MKLTFFLLFIASYALAQQTDLPYREIPEYPNRYTAATVSARLIDGLGFRYYWATEGLRPEDLSYSPTGDGRTSLETLVHIYQLSEIVINSVQEKPTDFTQEIPAMSFDELRKRTLDNLKATSDVLLASKEKDLARYKMIFKRTTGTREFPFWNEINGPISDALWHVGQVVSMRRSSGNPFNAKANVLVGKLME